MFSAARSRAKLLRLARPLADLASQLPDVLLGQPAVAPPVSVAISAAPVRTTPGATTGDCAVCIAATSLRAISVATLRAIAALRTLSTLRPLRAL